MSAVNPWRELERELNTRQREAVFTTARHCLVLAGPGTGKTRTLVNRVVYLTSAMGAPPESILTLTFTRKAARVMVDRLARYLGEEAAAVRTGTFHHFCLELLRSADGRANVPKDFDVADEGRQLSSLRRAWNRLDISAREPEDKELRNLLGRFGSYRVHRDADLLSSLQTELFAEYRRLLRDERAIDFDDILDLARGLLEEDAELLAATRRRWPRVLVDEFQDTDALQYALLRLLVPADDEESSSFLVADDQQSIYAWRGADRRNVGNYRRDYAPVEVLLDENYRNRPAILTGARNLLAEGGEQGAARELVSRAEGRGELRLETFPGEEEEAEFVAADIRSIRSRDRKLRWGDIAVLYPKHSIGEYLETRLMAARIPVEMVTGRALLDQPRIRQVVAGLRILRNGSDEDALGTLLAAQLDEGSFALLRQVARARGDSLRAALDLLLRGQTRLSRLRKRWSELRDTAAGLEDGPWLEAARRRFPEGLGLDAYLGAEGEAVPGAEASDAHGERGRWVQQGEQLEHLSRLPWVLGGIVARLGNLRAGAGGRGLTQLTREILLEFERGDEEELPGDPGRHEGLADQLDRLRTALRKGRRVRVGHGASPQAARLLTDMLRAGLEPWHAQCLVADADAPAADTGRPELRLEIGADSLRLHTEDGLQLETRGAPGAQLTFRLYQLWRAAEHRSLRDYVIFDFETTGPDPARCELVEIAAIRWEDGREVERFETLVRPSGPIPREASAVHGISDAMVAAAPGPREAVASFLRFIGERDLVAHNGAGFDFPILRRIAREQGLGRPANALFDTLALARRLFPGERASLSALIDRFGIAAEARHRALDDCRCLGEAFTAMQKLHLARLRRRTGHEALAPAALAMHVAGESGGALAGENFALFRAGVRRLLSSGNDWIDRHVGAAGEDLARRREVEAELLAAAKLTADAPDLFTGLRSEEERFLSLVPRFDELYLGDSLAAFLDFLALYQAADFASGSDAVQLMTIHAAKGLEFEHVYLLGLEENVLPGFYALRSGDPEELAEERRLLYVGMTRAAAALTLTRAESRGGFRQEPSRFLASLAAGEAPSP